ncbi:9499_t:CDS:2 [Dentiscutata erythropus]|uniref:9499_t:CDS:1 n=2 Tax=Gigasporaceae TaxID=36753 RepID=A0A9N8WKI8_9GLOM|nr:9499_t:CDS:2 [Dentiscutata erythropus]
MSSNISSNLSTLFTKDTSTVMSSNTNSPADMNSVTANSSPTEGVMEQYFVLERKARSYFTLAEISQSQQIRGLSNSKENKSRAQWCSFIVAVGNKLGFPQNTITTAQILFNRFYLFHPEKDFSTANQKSDLSITCLFVATKIEETYKKLRDILVEAYKVRHPELTDVNGENQMFEDQRRRVIQIERLVVETICFDFHIWPPHQLLMKFVKKLKGDKFLAVKAYNILNECYKTTLCLRFPPNALAAASILLASKLLHKENFPENRGSIPWYTVFLCRIEDIEEICKLLLDHFILEASLDKDDPLNSEYMRIRFSINSVPSSHDLITENPQPLMPTVEGEQKHYTVRYMFSLSSQYMTID